MKKIPLAPRNVIYMISEHCYEGKKLHRSNDKQEWKLVLNGSPNKIKAQQLLLHSEF